MVVTDYGVNYELLIIIYLLLLIINSLNGRAEVWGVRSDFLCRRCYFRPSEAEISQALDGQDTLALFL